MPYVNPGALIGVNEKKIIHTVVGKLKLSRDTYEDILFMNARVKSSNDLTYRGYWAVMDRLKEIGNAQGVKVFVGGGGPRRGGKKTRPYRDAVTGRKREKRNAPLFGAMATPEQQKTIWALWEDVARNKTRDGLRHFLERRFKISDIRFLTRQMAIDVTEALKAMKKRQDPEWEGISR